MASISSEEYWQLPDGWLCATMLLSALLRMADWMYDAGYSSFRHGNDERL
nr:hypothetical protein [Paenisporosarcina indica]